MAARKASKNNKIEVDVKLDIEHRFVHLARLSLEGRHDDVAALARQTLNRIGAARKDLRGLIRSTLEIAQGSPTRRQIARPLPADAETRLELVRSETAVSLVHEPRWPLSIDKHLRAIVKERLFEDRFRSSGIFPTRSVLFIGPPGVGKTLAARWLAREINRPLLTLDLAAVMNSFLGKTGANLRLVMDHAKREPSVLLLDEFDSVAKRRDDASEVGELKRLVTVLIQELDTWPDHGLLICATNHSDLLDPAVWRRFDLVLPFPMPTVEQIKALIVDRLALDSAGDGVSSLVANALLGGSFADVDKLTVRAQRNAIVEGTPIETALLELVADHIAASPVDTRMSVATALAKHGFSQRRISQVTGIARDTIRNRSSKGSGRSSRKAKAGAHKKT